jgi:hypothetical protein
MPEITMGCNLLEQCGTNIGLIRVKMSGTYFPAIAEDVYREVNVRTTLDDYKEVIG